tara:strand:- start:355 stop:612 length:258 start_codon:yes stop_codon:yes gene_type:complete
MKYRNTNYKFREWTSYSGTECSGYNCNDESLLSNVDTVSFGTKTKAEMHTRIDYYLDNIQECIEHKKRNDYAAGVFYQTLTYKGD